MQRGSKHLKKVRKKSKDLVVILLQADANGIRVDSPTTAKHLSTNMMTRRKKVPPTQSKNAQNVVHNNTHPKNANLQVYVDGAKRLDTRIRCVVRKNRIGQKHS